MTIVDDAINLDHWIRNSAPTPQHGFSVGVGGDRLHVFCQCEPREWIGEHTPRWNGIDVKWHFIGKVEALASVTPAK
jgi:hypothetical protein